MGTMPPPVRADNRSDVFAPSAWSGGAGGEGQWRTCDGEEVLDSMSVLTRGGGEICLLFVLSLISAARRLKSYMLADEDIVADLQTLQPLQSLEPMAL